MPWPMTMPVMNIRIVGMRVRQRFMTVRVRMRLRAIPGKGMRVLVVLVVHVTVAMFHGFVGMFVRMPFAQVQPHAQRHQGGRRPE